MFILNVLILYSLKTKESLGYRCRKNIYECLPVHLATDDVNTHNRGKQISFSEYKFNLKYVHFNIPQLHVYTCVRVYVYVSPAKSRGRG